MIHELWFTHYLINYELTQPTTSVAQVKINLLNVLICNLLINNLNSNDTNENNWSYKALFEIKIYYTNSWGVVNLEPPPHKNTHTIAHKQVQLKQIFYVIIFF